MKRTLLLCWCIICALSACEKDQDPGKTPVPGKSEPVEFPVGQPFGPVTTFTITPAGGTFTSPDHALKLTVPAGAVKADQQITVQSVENTAPAGSGPSIRLLPHMQFEKPVTIEVSYAAVTGEISSTSFLDLAYQNEKGHWTFAAKPTINAANKTVSVQTTHFSDWTIAQTCRLTPTFTSTEAGKQVSLSVIRYVTEDGMLTDLTSGEAVSMVTPVPLEVKYIKDNGGENAWALGGDGDLQGKGNKATYFPPDMMLEPKTVNVTVDLYNKNDPQTRHILVSTIEVSTGTMVKYRINGGAWKQLPNALVTEVEPNRYALASIVDPTRINLSWEGGVGTHRWNGMDEDRPDYITDGGILDINLLTQSHAYYETADGYFNSGGGVTITRLDKAQRKVEGSFCMNSAGVLSGTTGEQIRIEKIEGQFVANFMSVTDIPTGKKSPASR